VHAFLEKRPAFRADRVSTASILCSAWRGYWPRSSRVSHSSVSLRADLCDHGIELVDISSGGRRRSRSADPGKLPGARRSRRTGPIAVGIGRTDIAVLRGEACVQLIEARVARRPACPRMKVSPSVSTMLRSVKTLIIGTWTKTGPGQCRSGGTGRGERSHRWRTGQPVCRGRGGRIPGAPPGAHAFSAAKPDAPWTSRHSLPVLPYSAARCRKPAHVDVDDVSIDRPSPPRKPKPRRSMPRADIVEEKRRHP